MRPSTKGVSTTTITSFRIPFIMRGDSKAKRQDPTIERPIDDGLIFPGLLPGESKGIVKEGNSSTPTRSSLDGNGRGKFIVALMKDSSHLVLKLYGILARTKQRT